MKAYLFIYLFPPTLASIDVFITGSLQTNFTTRTSGSDRSIVTDSDRIYFNITDKIIKTCVKKYLGIVPDDVFVHGPTPWGDLFKKHKWTEAYRILTPISSRVVNIASSPHMLKQQSLDTNQTNSIKISQIIYNRFSTTWIEAGNMTVKSNCHIDVDSFQMTYESFFGVNNSKLKAVTTGFSVNELHNLGHVVIELYATIVSIKVEVEYQAKLWGNLALNYDKALGGHHFYSPNLEEVLFDCGLPNSLIVKEVIDVGFYTDAKVVVRNENNGVMMMTQNIEIYSL